MRFYQNIDKHCCDVCCDKFPVPQIDRKSKQVKEKMENFIWNQYGETRYFKHRKYQNLGINNKVIDVIKMQICFHFVLYLLNICRKFEFLISQGIAATCLM